MSRKTAAIVLAAGMGTRMKSALPKVMHPVAGRAMLLHVLDTISALSPSKEVVVIGPEMEAVASAVAPRPTAVQKDRLGTAHAVACAREALAGFDGDVLILYGDTPLITLETLDSMLGARHSASHPAIVVLGFRPKDPAAYGRLIMGPNGLEQIVEFRDASPAERAVDLCNSGVMAVDGAKLFGWLDKVDNKNAKGEYYLTDIVAIARAEGLNCAVVEGSEEEMLGVNSRVDLAQAEAVAQSRLRETAMLNGATLTDPNSVTFCYDTRLGRDVVIGPNVVFGPGVTIGNNVEIRPFCHIEGTKIDEGAVIGPFARLRPGSEIGRNAHIGNFVELKKTRLEEGAKVNHLSYVGDARVGAKANVGAGTITCNYDGFLKYHTDIGAGAFIGSNSALVAPVKIGDGAIVGAGSVITKDIPADALGVARGDQKTIPGMAARFRASKQALKGKK
jgi:bifunctional UDP-N-acetylglucosamine pyrophosphorylase/glucosamine-1-phosphate N-acetyltransferase